MVDLDPNDDSFHRQCAVLEQLRTWSSLLLDEAGVLRDSNAELMRQIAEERSQRRADRSFRRAALNLMEDAVAARLAEQRENAAAPMRSCGRHKKNIAACLNPLTRASSSLSSSVPCRARSSIFASSRQTPRSRRNRA